MSKTASVRHGVAWMLMGNTGNQVLSFLVGIVLARLLTPGDFGMLVSIQIYTGLAGFVAGGGMGQALVQAKEVERSDYDAVFTIQLSIGCLIFAAFFAIAPWFATWYGVPAYKDLLRVSALSFLIRPFVNLLSNFMFRERRFKVLALVNVTALLFSGFTSAILAWLDWGVWSLILGGLAGALFTAIVLVSQSGWWPQLSRDWKRARALARYGMLVTIDDFLVYLRNQAPNFVLSRTLGAHSLGLFNKAASWAVIPQALTGSVYQVTFRMLARDQDNLARSQQLYLRAITLVALYTGPAFLTFVWLAEPLIRFFYGEKWVDASPILTWLALIGPFLMLEMLAGSVLAARDWLHREIPVQLAELLIVVLGAVGGLRYGLLGVAIGASTATVYGALHMSWLAARCLRMPAWRILHALVVPVVMVSAIGLLWLGLDRVFLPWKDDRQLLYLATMLACGGSLFGVLFLVSPIEMIVTERRRWIDALKKHLSDLQSQAAP